MSPNGAGGANGAVRRPEACLPVGGRTAAMIQGKGAVEAPAVR